MRPLNIYALTRVKEEQTLGRLEKQLSRRGRMLKIKQWEIEGLRAFSDHLCRVWEDASELDFYFSFTMPKLGKEFDLLRINDDSVINIELKSGNVTDAAGQYEIKFPKKWATEVQFSMLGKEKVTLPLGKKKKINVVLKNEALELDPGYLDQPAGAFRIVPQNQ